MTPAIWSALGVIGAAFVAGLFGWVTQRQVRALGSRAEDRSDFAELREAWREENKGLRERLQSLEQAQADDRRAQADDRHIIATALRYISQITHQMRAGGLEPPPLPAELADRMREY
ncbi:hypothetical protein [Actinomadura sp. WMMA1423]|uniref:hypothetical protein n=1 Tax=Actinomadura sp. WMMA1423 TaxID=2591108 RepID=UPI0011466D44|nr:hypothetical protein [Actinomadura sp. WMMA1423]